ncbi:MAG: DMT family transporter [Rhodobacter sp.]|nr:DMT family transporter [Paracoccaceae bacterium]MCC0075821.1 DMT family transporter [Rhodobacter sp.]
MVVFCAIAPLIDVSAKFASQEVTVTQVTLFRLVFQAVLMAPVVLLMGQDLRLSRRQVAWVLARALMLVASTAAFVGAVQVMPIADALAIAFVEPFLLLALGAVLFGEHVGPRRISAAVVGFIGALLVIQPNFAAFGAVALFPLVTAAFFALYMLLTRRISRELPPEAMQFHTAWLGTLLVLPVVMAGHGLGIELLMVTNPSPAVWGQLLGVGLAATVSHMAITYALRFAPSATLAPLHYLEIVNAVLFGYLFFGDFPNPLSMTGIAVIVGSGLYVIARERALARQARTTSP